MTPTPRPFRAVLSALVALAAPAVRADVQSLTLVAPPPAESGYFKMGTARNPDGRELTLDSRSLRLDGQPWVPVMGEFHYTRYPAAEWRGELLKMKAGGIDLVSTYVFWIHHEEIEGAWDWSGQRDLRRFIEAVRDVGLNAVVRCGPWCHGEVRNGGLPEWVVQHADWKLRSTDPKFLDSVRALYGQIALQLRGLLWKDGGPVVGIQLDNEFRGPAAYLIALKGIARDAGLDVPLYTRTGWPALTTPMPLGEILPLYGAYAEGFWDRTAEAMPGEYWREFTFRNLRTNNTVGTDASGSRAAKDDDDSRKYPYLACEIGGGMADSYHRRVLVPAGDVEVPAFVQIGSGSALPGYYMYHGGTNPDGKLTTLQELQATALTNWNDLPVKTYDFQAPLGEYGQVRESYHRLRRLHLFLHDFGAALAGMPATFAEKRPAAKTDTATLRWAVRSDGRAGFVFVNNYQRLQPMPAKPGVQFALTLADGGALTFPSQPVTVPADSHFFWPFNLDLGGATLAFATAQPLCRIDEADGTRTFFFAETRGVPAEFAFNERDIAESKAFSGKLATAGGILIVREVQPGRAAALTLATRSGQRVHFVLLNDADSLALWKGAWAGRERAFLTRANLVLDGEELRLTATEVAAPFVAIFPAPAEVLFENSALVGGSDGVFRRYTLPTAGLTSVAVEFTQVKKAGPAREIHNGPIKQPVAQEPAEADYAQAAEWRVRLPAGIDLARDPLLRFHYAGDVARLTLDGKMLTDDFYNGLELDLGLRRHAPGVLTGELRLAVLPLRKDAPFYLAKSAWPDFGGAPSLAALRSIELIQTGTATLTARRVQEPALPNNFKTDKAFGESNRL